MIAGCEHAERHPANFLTIRYEDLLDHPAEQVETICGAVGLAYEAGMLRYHEGKQPSAPRSSAKKNWLPPTKGLRDWRETLSAEDAAVFQRLAGDCLTALGYEVDDQPDSRCVVKRAAKAVAWWSANREVKTAS